MLSEIYEQKCKKISSADFNNLFQCLYCKYEEYFYKIKTMSNLFLMLSIRTKFISSGSLLYE